MGKTDINEFIGYNETIGLVAGPDHATCTDHGCTRIEKTCVILLTINDSKLAFILDSLATNYGRFLSTCVL